MVTQTRLKELLKYDPSTGIFIWRVDRKGGAFAGDVAGRIRQDGYRELRVDHGFYPAHRLAWIYMHGAFNNALQIDHINRVKADNRIENLRLATSKQNKENISPTRNSAAGLLGVNWNRFRNKWQARICHDGVRKYLGLFETAEAAHDAYLVAKRELHSFGTL